MLGTKFGRLTVLADAGFKINGTRRRKLWLCRCDCGTEVTTRGDGLRSGHASSCGCLQRERVAEVTSHQVGAAHPGWKGGVAGYQSRHNHLRRHRGPASNHACVDCGRPAANWSWSRDCDEPLMGTSQGHDRPYCLHDDHYSPRCLECHWRLDHQTMG